MNLRHDITLSAAALRGALGDLVACEGGAWHVERYAKERKEALGKARSALALADADLPTAEDVRGILAGTERADEAAS